MREIFLALGRALRSLTRRDVLLHLLWPSLASLVIWVTLAIFFWNPIVMAVIGWIEGWSFAHDWLTASEAGAATTAFVVNLSMVLALLPLIYVTAVVLLAVFALPMLLERVATRDYADLERRRGGSNLGSAWNAVVAGLLFFVALILSLPFWLIPGVGLVASVALTGWLNQRAFGYDALMLHADREELRRLPRQLRQSMLLLGGGCALLAYIPVVNLVAPPFCGLAFVHYMLASLRRDRQTQGVSIVDALPGSPS